MTDHNEGCRQEVVTTVSDELTELVPRVNFERRRANCWPPFFLLQSVQFDLINSLCQPFSFNVYRLARPRPDQKNSLIFFFFFLKRDF